MNNFEENVDHREYQNFIEEGRRCTMIEMSKEFRSTKLYQVYFQYAPYEEGVGMFGRESKLFTNIETARLYMDKSIALIKEINDTPYLNYYGDIPISATLVEIDTVDDSPEEYVFPHSMPDVIEIEPDYPEDDFDWQSYYYPEECIDDFTIDESGGFTNKDNWEPDLCIGDLAVLKEIKELLEK